MNWKSRPAGLRLRHVRAQAYRFAQVPMQKKRRARKTKKTNGPVAKQRYARVAVGSLSSVSERELRQKGYNTKRKSAE